MTRETIIWRLMTLSRLLKVKIILSRRGAPQIRIKSPNTNYSCRKWNLAWISMLSFKLPQNTGQTASILMDLNKGTGCCDHSITLDHLAILRLGPTAMRLPLNRKIKFWRGHNCPILAESIQGKTSLKRTTCLASAIRRLNIAPERIRDSKTVSRQDSQSMKTKPKISYN